jgi:uncharacterized integral membrane protein
MTAFGSQSEERNSDERLHDPQTAPPPGGSVPSTRTSATWTFVAIAVAILVVVLVFILENLHATDATFFGIHWRIPLGLDLLLAALLGAVAVLVIGAARTLQLRLLARRGLRRQSSDAFPRRNANAGQ